MKVQLAILAAGRSSRLGRPKQLIEWDEQTLLYRVTQTALRVRPSETSVFIITGAYAEQVAATVADLPVTLLYNADWSEGMAASVRVATTYAIEQQADALLFLLTDQPHLTTSVLEEILHLYAGKADSIVVSDYGSDWGVPMLFGSDHFSELLTLEGDRGAKPLAKHYVTHLKKVVFPLGSVDIDTEEDWKRFAKSAFNA